jgi:hypothetical protein
VFQQLQGQINIQKGDDKFDYHFNNCLIYNLDKICVLNGEELQLIKENHTSKVVEPFGVGKTISNLQWYVY